MITAESVQPLDYPELVIGIAAPIGVDMDLIVRSLGAALAEVGYSNEKIKLTDEMERFSVRDRSLKTEINRWKGNDTFNTYMRKMSQANALRKQYDDAAVLSRIAIDTIKSRRGDGKKRNEIRPKHAYIIRQLKRPEEVTLLRMVYGRQFVLASA